MRFIELKDMEEFKKAFMIMYELCGHLNEEEYLSMLDEMTGYGYRLFALADENGEEYFSLAGVSIAMDFFNGRHLFIYELVTAEKHKSKGIGQAMVHHLEGFAKSQGCKKIILYSGLQRTDAHNFWENRLGYEKRGIVFKKILEQ